MERRVLGNQHARCEPGEKVEIISKPYLSVYKYGPRNWEKGIPLERYVDSGIRHYLKTMRGDDDERHDRAFMWNMLCGAATCRMHPELNTFPVKEE